MALVTLVVIGHAWTLLPADELNSRLYDFVYAWHIPAFVFVTGYLSRAFDYAPERMWQLVRTVAVPYVVFECLMALFRVHVGGEHLEDVFKDPHWPMWYLAALLCWRLMTPLFRRFAAGPAVTLAVLLSLVSGMWGGEAFEVLDLTRVFGLLPFFVLGLFATPERLELLRGSAPRWLGVVVLAGVWQLTALTDDLAATEWLYYRAPYGELGASDATGVVTRLAVIAIGAVAMMAFLALVPRRGGWFARMGGATLIVYLFHGFVVRAALYAGYTEWTADHSELGALLTLAGSIAVALALAAPPVARRLQHLVDPFGAAERRMKEAVDLTVVAGATEQKTGSLPPMQDEVRVEAAKA
jgi:fucose 4-O-acetylase-like acetyltransferase